MANIDILILVGLLVVVIGGGVKISVGNINIGNNRDKNNDSQ